MTAEPPLDSARIFEAYHSKVRAYAAKLIGPEEADDVAQEVFAKVDRSLSTLEDPAKLTPWIYAITLNVVRDAARKRSSRPAIVGLASDREASGGAGELDSGPRDGRSPTPEEAAIRNEMVACYLDYVKQLPAAYYDVYVLSELEHLTNTEIASRLSVSLGTVKIRLHRARALLHEELRRNCRCYYDERGSLMGAPKNG
jgi:RNA polymerase sigma-70 factor, ECF subfamily